MREAITVQLEASVSAASRREGRRKADSREPGTSLTGKLILILVAKVGPSLRRSQFELILSLALDGLNVVPVLMKTIV